MLRRHKDSCALSTATTISRFNQEYVAVVTHLWKGETTRYWKSKTTQKCLKFSALNPHLSYYSIMEYTKGHDSMSFGISLLKG